MVGGFCGVRPLFMAIVKAADDYWWEVLVTTVDGRHLNLKVCLAYLAVLRRSCTFPPAMALFLSASLPSQWLLMLRRRSLEL